jgi:hypothetical protein
MSIRQMLPVGSVLRSCVVCGYQITAASNVLTAHEAECLKIPETKMSWRVEGNLIMESFHPHGEIGGDVIVGSMVNKGGGLWNVEIIRFDGDRIFKGRFNACLAFIEIALSKTGE